MTPTRFTPGSLRLWLVWTGLTACNSSPPPDSDASVTDLAAALKDQVTIDDLERHTRAIVAHPRPSGSEGENAAIDYIVRTLEASGVPVEVHTVPTYTSNPVAARVRVPGTDFDPDAITMSFSAPTAGLEARVVDMGALGDLPPLELGTGERLILPGDGLDDALRRSYTHVRGAIAVVEGQPRNVPTAVLYLLGAVGVIFVNPEERLNELIVTSTWGTPSLLNYHRLPDIPTVQIKRSDGDRLRSMMADGPIRVRLQVEVDAGWRPLRLAVARIEPDGGPTPYVLFGGHIDGWHHGGTDEGASNGAMVSIAKAFHRHRDRLRRGLVVAWWPGHSNARYGGSTWFADRFFDDLRTRAVAYVNVDGIGQTGAKRFGATTSAAFDRLARGVVSGARDVSIEPGRPGRNSDQAFNGIGLPLMQLNHTRLAEDGGYWWWHTPEDNIDKVDFEILKGDADLYVDALAAMLAAPVYPLDIEAQLEELERALTHRAEESGGRLDLTAAHARLDEVRDVVSRWTDRLPSRVGPATDLAVVRLLRPVHRVLYVPLTEYHPDPGLSLGPLPGLAPARILAEEDSTTARYRLAVVTLTRERNRLMEALDVAHREALALRTMLERPAS